MPRTHRLAALALTFSALVLAACGPPPEVGEDGGFVEEDAGLDDAGACCDAGGFDAGSFDAGPPDSGILDAGPVDGGVPCSVGGRAGWCIDVALCTGTRSPTPGYCPGPTQIQCCTERPDAGACDENARPTPNQGLVEEPGVGGCPAGMIPISTFCIDRFEGSLASLDGGSWSPFWNPGVVPLRAVSLRSAVPQG
ncbi:MAG: hypothetical protein ACYC8T_38175, partial [Myxococcaceae bacterium]